MTETEFFYWLQGYFELSALMGVVTLNDKQVDCIRKHLQLVDKPGERLVEIRVMLRMGTLNERLITSLREVISEQFQHVIDPAAGDEKTQKRLNKIHGDNMRC